MSQAYPLVKLVNMESGTTRRPTPIRVARRPRVAAERVLDAATAVFAEDGFDGATMDAIAMRARTRSRRCTPGFGSKEAAVRCRSGA